MPRLIFSVFLFVLTAGAGYAQTGDVIADARLAYIAGDYATALAVLRPAAEAGDPLAQNIMGDAYEDGTGVAPDIATALLWYERAAAQDFDKALYNLGLLYTNGAEGVAPDFAKAGGYYDRAIALGYSFAMNNRARMFEEGQGGPVDLPAAAALYEQAADLGHALAMNNLGRLYIFGEGVPEDYAYALAMFMESAALGESRGLNNLGAMYENGYGVGQSDLAAMAIYKMAAEAGAPQGALNYAYSLIEGEAAWRNPGLGWAWCLAAIDRADAGADFSEDCDYLGGLLDEDTKDAGAALLPTLRR